MLSEYEFKRTCWASRRGMLELDLLLVPFCERRLRALDETGQRRYRTLLTCEDTQLYAWLLGRERPEDPELAAIVDIILAFARSTRDSNSHATSHDTNPDA